MALPEVAYGFYEDDYGGTAIDEESWPAAERRARLWLDSRMAMATVTALCDDAESMAVCAVADEEARIAAALAANDGAGPLTSVSVGSVSESYDATFGGAVDLTEVGRERSRMLAAKLYLHFYWGVG